MSQDDAGESIYSAALAGAADLPADVGAFALEMARRRPLAAASRTRVEGLRAAMRVRREASAREHPARRRRAAPAHFPSSREDLPPWPLGPSGRLITSFRDAVLHGHALTSLMQSNPTVASEALLACMIDDHPTRSSSDTLRTDDELGMEFDQQSYPTIFWKSPFFGYFQRQPQAALAALKQLLDFAMERWAADVPEGARIPSIRVTLRNGERRVFRGNHASFGWSQRNSVSNGQLFSALDALERWLILKIDAGDDIAPWCRRLLDMESSTAIMGVVVNLGKYQPSLFQGPLSTLLEIEALYWWDDRRVKSVGFNFDAMSWTRQGHAVFNTARDWVLAPHRRTALRCVVGDLVARDADLAARVVQRPHIGPNLTIRRRPSNCASCAPSSTPPIGTASSMRRLARPPTHIAYPADLQQAVAAYQQQAAAELQPIFVQSVRKDPRRHRGPP